MPTYDYECSKGHRFEVFQKMSDEPVASCPKCGEAAQRLISGGAGFLFKGDGFYITDYRSDEYKKKASAEAPDASSGAGTSKQGSGGVDAPAGSAAGGQSSGGAGGSSGNGTSGGSGAAGSSKSSSGGGSGSAES